MGEIGHNEAMKIVWRKILAAGMLLLTFALGGCGQRNPGGAAGVEKANGKIVLDFWNGFTGPDGKTMEKIVAQFRKENPDIVVRMQIIPWGTYYDKLTLALAYGGAPEVFIMHAARLPEFAAFNTLQPIGKLFAQSQLQQSAFADVPWRASFFDGKQLALPLDVHPMGLYFNTELFEKAGIVDAQGKAKPPRTLDEFIADGQKLTKDLNGDGRPDQWGFVFTNGRTNWLTITQQFGGGILSDDLKSAQMDTPANLKSLQLMHDFIYKYKIAPRPEGVDSWLAFSQGKVAMAMEGIYMVSSLEEQKGLQFAGAPVPQFGPKSADWGGSHFLCQPAGIAPEASQAAWKLMRYLSDHSLTWAQGGQVPARTDVRQMAGFKALPVQSQFARQLPYVQYEPLSPRMNAIFPFVDPVIEAVLLDLQTPQAALKDSQRRIEQVLKRP